MHGHDFLLLGAGNGTFNFTTDFPNLQLNNPPRRDVATLPTSDAGQPTGGWIVIGFPLDNPGIWVPLPPSSMLTIDDSLPYRMACKRRLSDAIRGTYR
jgi:hypothetical protein